MITLIWNMLSIKAKVVLGIFVLSVIGSLWFIFSYQSSKINELNNSLLLSETTRKFEKVIYDEERLKAKQTIEDQNKSINKYKLDTEKYENTISEKQIEINKLQIKKQKEIAIELSKDSSSDNQLKIITNILKEFSNEKH